MSLDSTRELARSIAQECLGLRVRQVGRVVSAVYEKELRPTGMTIAQFNLMVALACGLRTAKDLGDRLHLEKSTLSRNLERLVHQGWVDAQPANDGRSVNLELTAAGRSKLRAAYPSWKRAQAATRSLLGSDALQHLEGLTKALR